MKSDTSRDLFRASKHYAQLRMQQGRVQLDADWNEQSDIERHRIETETRDTIGHCGGPIHEAAFEISASAAPTPFIEATRPPIFRAVFASGSAAASGPTDYLIGAGRYYVDGILCINETQVPYTQQPDLPGAVAFTDPGQYIVYVDVWNRHITALDDPSIREVALGGPDTTTRVKTVWQVKHFFAGADAAFNCLTEPQAFKDLLADPTGQLTARTKTEQASTNPCIVPPGAGYRGLENQLYRVEIHDSGEAFSVDAAPASFVVTSVQDEPHQVQFTAGSWSPGQAIEFISTAPGADPMNGTLAIITAVDAGTKTLTVNVDTSAFTELRIRPVGATFKWSRDNGSIVTAVENIKDAEVTVHDLGPDAVLGFREGQWVEYSDDLLELNGRPGILAQIVKIDRAIRVITLDTALPALPLQSGLPDASAKPKLRIWHGAGAVKFHPSGADANDLELENGVMIRFSAGTYRSHDYWTIPARTATADAQSGNIEWPAGAGGERLAQAPFGIRHHYCRLAVVNWDGGTLTVEDCRNLFPPLTELVTLLYAGGDGQEAMPGDPLPQLLQGGVFNGRWPVEGARVRFTAQGNGRLAATKADLATSTTNTIVITTGPDGIASCAWLLEPDVNTPSQQVEARLLDADSQPTPSILHFNANLSIADQVWYDPGTCAALAGRSTVQDAVDQLARLVSLYPVSGDDQEVMPGTALQPLVVLAANRCGPVQGQKVRFSVVPGSTGTLSATDVITDPDGRATVTWTLDATTPRQQVDATLIDEAAPSIAPATTVRFTANLSTASQVAYDPKACELLSKAGVKTVEAALDELCRKLSEPAIHVVKVTTGGREVLVNDVVIDLSSLDDGIIVECDGDLDPVSAGPPPDSGVFLDSVRHKPTCFVTFDLPYPLGNEANFWDFGNIFGFQPLVLNGTVDVKGTQLQWRPHDHTRSWFAIMFDRLNKTTDRVLAHLTLKGNFIWGGEGEKLRYLDGQSFGRRSKSDRTDLVLPSSGDGWRGGDFEMWFWVAPLKRGNPSFDINVIILGRNVGGLVITESGAPLPGFTVTLKALPGRTTRTALTNEQGAFSFPNVVPGNYEISVEALGITVEKQITVGNVNPL